ncbi:hypothetical protein HBI31_057820 [Parastagonospora nodorum]|nr:hypothetical protein HBI31_057820 [Parastagonospora nodorum]
MHASLRKELEARHSLLNLSVHDLSVYAVFKCLASSSNLSTTIRCRANKYSKKHLKVRKADALKIIAAYITLIRLELEAQLRKVSKEEELAKTKKEKREKENKIVAIDSVNSILCDLSNLLVIRFCIFSNSALENIGILTNKEVVEMQTNTATALANKLAAVNKLFIIVCGFRKVDKHIFRAYNTISVTAQRTIIRKGSSYIKKRRRTVFNKFYNYKLEGIIIAKFY